jgi:hypothetical protein
LLEKDRCRQIAGGGFSEATMTLAQKLVLGGAAILLAGAASFPGEIRALYQGSYPTDARKRDALAVCQLNSPSFIRFLASEREECYARMRAAIGEHTGTWSKHDRSNLHVAQVGR